MPVENGTERVVLMKWGRNSFGTNCILSHIKSRVQRGLATFPFTSFCHACVLSSFAPHRSTAPPRIAPLRAVSVAALLHFSNTCPLMINYLPEATNGVPTGTTNIIAGLYIAKPPVTSYSGINLQDSQASHPLLNCRLYYSQITVQPEKSIRYIEQNRN